MGKPSDKKRAKQRARQQADRTRALSQEKQVRIRLAQQRYSDTYPAFRYVDKGAPAAFVELVKEAIRGINFDDATTFPEWQREYYRHLKKNGSHAAERFLGKALKSLEQHNSNLAQVVAVDFGCSLGSKVFQSIPKPRLLDYIPFADVQIVPCGYEILVIFRSLLSKKAPGGTIYYSRHEPTIEVDGEKRIVGFSRHAIEQICERCVPGWDTYAGLGDAFALFNECWYFERSDLEGGQLALTLYDVCADEPFWSHRYLEEVLDGKSLAGQGKWYYRVGYCPCVIENDFVKAKTLLYPGFKRTPEYRTIDTANLPRDRKEEMKKAAFNQTQQNAHDGTFDFGLVRWFHEHGVPQVVHFEKDLYLPPVV